MRKMNFLAASVLAASVAMTGCANKAQTGTAIGAGIGGLACNFLAKNTSDVTRVIAISGCAAIGGYIGNVIGKNLDERDRIALAAQTQQALKVEKSGTYNWKSEHSGATAQITVGEPFKRTEKVSVKHVPSVKPSPSMEKLNAQYLTLKGANVRSAPTTSSDKMGFLPAMTEFNAMGKTGDWILVGRKGVAVGYIYSPLVQSKVAYEAKLNATQVASTAPVKVVTKPAEPIQVASAPTPAPAVVVPEAPKVVAVPAVKLDEVTTAALPELDKLASDAPVLEEIVEETETCRSMESKVTDAKGKVESSTSNACKKIEENIWADA